jgi:hypothetical protein
LKTFHSGFFLKSRYSFVAGCWVWLGCYHKYGSHNAATFHTYLEIPI